MRKRLLALCLALCCLLLCGCSFGSGTKYATKDELEALKELQTSSGGDSYTVNITASENASRLGAAKALLSAVSIKCTFEELYTSIWPPYGSSQSTLREAVYYGAGVIYQIDKTKGDAYIITNYHVIYDSNGTEENGICQNIKLFLYGSESEQDAIPATFVGGSAAYDIAVLKVSGSAALKQSIAAAVTFADSDKISVLDTAIAIGNPGGMGISATAGYVSVDSEDITLAVTDAGYSTMRVMRIDTAVNGGNSGGGLFDENGNLIGIVNAKISDTSIENIAYAIPSNVAKHLAESILENEDGRPTRCILGVVPAILSSRAVYDSETGKITIRETVTVSQIKDGSAAKDKLAAGDIILSMTIDGTRIEVQRKFQVIENMFAAGVGSTVSFEILRGEQTLTVSFEITEDMVTLM